jgi:hypothetical protein
VTRPPSPLTPRTRQHAPDDEELALEVDALINELGVGVDASSIEVEAIEPARTESRRTRTMKASSP